MRPTITNVQRTEVSDKEEVRWIINYTDEDTGERSEYTFNIKTKSSEDPSLNLIRELMKAYIIHDHEEVAEDRLPSAIKWLRYLAKFHANMALTDLADFLESL